ncbi:hypothetical protein E4U60_003734 [Claviceps pazoutovae]|uniref:Uncharacterized protein n=1 Tax=Claviceps pazoutovae TaxID=1649127 RepID=A0A9P7MKB5_9HYPO|nr:hypothetical protein E4U60_003734 [Claviceps pazoutovae]
MGLGSGFTARLVKDVPNSARSGGGRGAAMALGADQSPCAAIARWLQRRRWMSNDWPAPTE